MLDLIVRRGNLPDGRLGMDVACRDGRIVEVAANIDAPPATPEIDAGGCLVTPPFVDSHFHLDSTLSYGRPRVNQSGTLLEGIALWGEFAQAISGDGTPQLKDSALFRQQCYIDGQWADADSGASIEMTIWIRSHAVTA